MKNAGQRMIEYGVVTGTARKGGRIEAIRKGFVEGTAFEIGPARWAKCRQKQVMERYPTWRKIVGTRREQEVSHAQGSLIGTERSFNEVMSNKIRNKIRQNQNTSPVPNTSICSRAHTHTLTKTRLC